MPTTKTRRPGTKAGAPPATRMSLAEAMTALEKAGTAQARKTYTRHGAKEPMFGTSFAVIGQLRKRIGVDHDLAKALWATGNFDARNLAFKVVDPAKLSASELDRWGRETNVGMCALFISMLAQEGPRGRETAERWLSSSQDWERSSAWGLVGQLAARDASIPDAWFEKRLAEIERTIHTAPNDQRWGMNQAVIFIGCRNANLRKAALAAAKRIGKVDIDHGDTACKTPDVVEYVEKTWAHSTSKGFESPAAHERSRDLPRRRC